jgi:hypothetical protein
MTTTTTEKVTVIVEIEADDLWSAVFGSAFESDPVSRAWLVDYSFVEGDWDKSGIVQITYRGGHFAEVESSKMFNVQDLAAALSTAIARGYRHVPCGGKIDADFDNYDACVGDLLLQIMVYGEEVFA